MTRRLLNLLTVLSLLLCVAVAVLWVRSHWAVDGYTWTVDGGARAVRSSGGRLAYLRAASVDEAQYPFPTTGIPTGYDSGPSGSGPPVAPPAWSVAGFSHGEADAFALRFRESTIPHWSVSAVAAILPAWWSVARAKQARLRSRGDAASLCPACGYDIRATPEKCPECGHVPVAGREAQ